MGHEIRSTFIIDVSQILWGQKFFFQIINNNCLNPLSRNQELVLARLSLSIVASVVSAVFTADLHYNPIAIPAPDQSCKKMRRVGMKTTLRVMIPLGRRRSLRSSVDRLFHDTLQLGQKKAGIFLGDFDIFIS